MFVYQIKNGYLISKGLTYCQRMGYIKDFKEKFNKFPEAWLTNEDLGAMTLPDNSFRYSFIDGKPKERPFHILGYKKNKLISCIKPMYKKILTDNYDWKVLKHYDEREELANGVIKETSLTEEQFSAVLAEKRFYRDLSNAVEERINAATTMERLTEIETLFKQDFSNIEVAREILNKLNT